MTPHLLTLTDTRTIRAQNRLAQRRGNAVDNVRERLSVFGTYPAEKRDDPAFQLQTADSIVRAVVALLLAPEVQ